MPRNAEIKAKLPDPGDLRKNPPFSAVNAMQAAPKLDLSVHPQADYQLLDIYIRLVQAKTVNDACRELAAGEAARLSDLVERTGRLARQKYGEEQGARVTGLGEEAGRAVTRDDERKHVLQANMQLAARAQAGQASPVSAELRSRLERYSRLSVAYYVECKCKHLWRWQRRNFWKAVNRVHDALLLDSMLGTTEARDAALSAAEAYPVASKESKRVVKAAYKEIMKRGVS